MRGRECRTLDRAGSGRCGIARMSVPCDRGPKKPTVIPQRGGASGPLSWLVQRSVWRGHGVGGEASGNTHGRVCSAHCMDSSGLWTHGAAWAQHFDSSMGDISAPRRRMSRGGWSPSERSRREDLRTDSWCQRPLIRPSSVAQRASSPTVAEDGRGDSGAGAAEEAAMGTGMCIVLGVSGAGCCTGIMCGQLLGRLGRPHTGR